MEAAKAESAPGFRSFWEKTKREEAHRNLTFVQVEDGGTTELSQMLMYCSLTDSVRWVKETSKTARSW